MKKIDLHIHTVKSISDADFSFSLDKLDEYVHTMKLDCIAITNHNLFNNIQFLEIQERLSDVVVFPGIEINLCGGHLLLISDTTALEEFGSRAVYVERKIVQPTDSLTYREFIDIYPDYSKYLLIPHFDKSPSLPIDTMRLFKSEIFVGEVCSPKKFIYAIKRNEITPALFSDCRLERTTSSFSSKQTFIDIGDITLNSLKSALRDKNKVSLTEEGGHDLISINNGEIKLSTGLNVILGKRSSGKTYSLNLLESVYGKDNITYIKQFQLLNLQEDEQRKHFDEMMTSQKSSLFEEYIHEFKIIIDDILKNSTEREDDVILEDYISSLLKYAQEEGLKDVYSSCMLYNESLFSIVENNELKRLIDSVKNVLENENYNEVIDKNISREGLKRLYIELVRIDINERCLNQKKSIVNNLTEDIQNQLRFNSSAGRISNIDFYAMAISRMKRQKFAEVSLKLKTEKIISERKQSKFHIIAKKRLFQNATDLSKVYIKKQSFANSYLHYNNPLKYIEVLDSAGVKRDEIYKLFITIDYIVLNEYGLPVSGGERSEFNLIQAIQDARNYDMLLVDEPESSFDNVFLKENINNMLKDMSREMPVVIVTHNSTIGASIQPDYIIYTERDIQHGEPIFKIYYGHPADKHLYSNNNDTIQNFLVQINSLEAGKDVYNERKQNYANLEN
ncbi:phosphotransferase [Bacteroides ovatus]|uniref:phosphotransferase n=1 Tax=Bacteroides ovatus TaxID=28116 RepID=UPI00321BEC3F